MAAPLFGAVIGAIAGGVGAGVMSWKNNKKLSKAYQGYADDIREAATKYSGHNADEAMRAAGNEQGLRMNNLSMDNALGKPATSNIGVQNALNAANNVRGAEAYSTGNAVGRGIKANELNAKYNAATAEAQQALNQAQINYQADTQKQQALMNGAAGLAQTYNQIKSDERAKEGYHNKEGLPEADAEDALRQIESIEYKYKPETGQDQDHHVGVTAQSLEGTAFDDVVSEGADGYKQLDKQKLLEAVMAGIAALQKEIDGKEIKSDERCKEVEDKIESKEIGPADLPEGSPIQKEASQLNDSSQRNNEVDNKAVEDYVRDTRTAGRDQGDTSIDTAVSEDYPKAEEADKGAPRPESAAPAGEQLSEVSDSDEDEIDPNAGSYDPTEWSQLPVDQKKVDKLTADLHKKEQDIQMLDLKVDQLRSYMEENPEDFEKAAELERMELLAEQMYNDRDQLQADLDIASTPEVALRQPAEEDPVEEEPAEEKSGFAIPDLSYGGETLSSNPIPEDSVPLDSIDMPSESSSSSRTMPGSSMLGRAMSSGSVDPVSSKSNTPSQSAASTNQSVSGGGVIPPKESKAGSISRGGSNNSMPSSNGSASSGPGMLLSKHTQYVKPSVIAPKLAMLGHSSNPEIDIDFEAIREMLQGRDPKELSLEELLELLTHN